MNFDHLINELLKETLAVNENALKDWLECFESTNSYEQLLKAKTAIKNSLQERELQSHPERNFLVKLISGKPHGYKDRNGLCDRRFELFTTFVGVMNKSPYWREFIATTLRATVPLASFDRESLVPSIHGSVKELTARNQLHDAAKRQQVQKVKKLLEDGELVTTNEHDCTPIHYAAMAIQPNAEIARLLVEALGSEAALINQRSDGSWGGNTALHIAAANINVTQEFINELTAADPRTSNSKMDTPFHVAAKSDNPNAIIYLLNTFAPTNAGWDVDVVDEGVDPKSTLINLCARKGNAKAVALLIQHGADISKGVLHEIILESVRHPYKIEILIEVYRVIIQNVVTWRCLEENYEVLPFKGYEDYTKIFRRTAVWLLTNPMEDYQHTDVLQCAIDHGAERMLWQIINTMSVFRLQNENKETTYDVSNFTEETLLPQQLECTATTFPVLFYDACENTERVFKQETVIVKHATSDCEDSDSSQSRSSFRHSFIGDWEPNVYLCEPDQARRINSSIPSNTNHKKVVRNFDELHIPAMPYLTYLLTYFDQWKCSDVLSWQPFNSLTKPYFTSVQRFYLFVGILQLVYTILFSWYYMPDACSLSMMFGIQNPYCSGSGNISLDQINVNESDKMTTSVSSQNRSYPSSVWLIWPAILMLYSIPEFYYSIKHEWIGARHKSKKKVVTAQDLRVSLPLMFCKAAIQSLTVKVFICSVPVWFHEYRHADTYASYVEVTALVLLFCWIANLHFFRTISKRFTISALVVKEIVMKDLSSFMMFFGFTVIGFSFAMHALRLSACKNELFYVHETFYSVLSSAFGIGDFFEKTITNPSCSSMGTRHLFEAVYFGYVCTTMIILLNVLIAMMNQRYEIAKCRVENLWRFRILTSMRGIESHKYLVKLIRKYKILSPWRHEGSWIRAIAWKFGCCFHDKNRSDLSFKHNRYYLRLVLPVDEK